MKIRYSEFANRIDVDAFEEAIGYEVTYQKTNKHGDTEDIGHCPDPWGLHKSGDSTGKFAINREKRIYNCWVCDGGSLLSLAMATRDLNEQDAADWLYQFTSAEDVSDEGFMSEIEAILAVEKKQKPVWPYFNPKVLDKWIQNLPHLAEWLEDRGISDDVAVIHKLGFDPKATRRSSKGDYTGPCIYFPHFWNDRLVGWQQRWLGDDLPKHVKKYTNTDDFPRHETIYNYERVYLSPRPIIVVESVPTVLYLASAGLPAVATFGSSVTPEQVRLLRRCQQGVVLAPDNDPAGRKWVESDSDPRSRRIPLASELARFVSTQVLPPVGNLNSSQDLGDLGNHRAAHKWVAKGHFHGTDF